MHLTWFATMPFNRVITEEDRLALRKIAWNPIELIHLKNMDHEQLLGLMVFCGIRTYNDMPVIACEDDELRMAYLAWRGNLSAEVRKEWIATAGTTQRAVRTVYDGLVNMFEHLV